MEIIFICLLVLVSLFALLLCIFWGIHPIWSLIDLATSIHHSSDAKIAWIFILLLTWSFGSILYGFLGTKSTPLKKATKLGLFGSLIFSGMAIALILSGVFASFNYLTPLTETTEHSTCTETTLKAQCLRAATWMLSSDATKVCKNPTSYTVECLQKASWMLSSDAVQVCRTARSETAQCIEASSFMLSGDAVKACQ